MTKKSKINLFIVLNLLSYVFATLCALFILGSVGKFDYETMVGSVIHNDWYFIKLIFIGVGFGCLSYFLNYVCYCIKCSLRRKRRSHYYNKEEYK